LPYVAYDLIFIYLKTKGVDPKTHPVISELDRVRQYFEKIANAEKPPTRRVEVDKEAAGRFIKHAIAQAVSTPTVNAHPSIPLPSTSTSVPAKTTTKMAARAQYEAALKRAREEEQGGEEQEELEVYDEPQPDSDSNSEGPITIASSSLTEVGSVASTSLKRRRPPVDPFAGYGEEDTTATEPSHKQPRRPSRNS